MIRDLEVDVKNVCEDSHRTVHASEFACTIVTVHTIKRTGVQKLYADPARLLSSAYPGYCYVKKIPLFKESLDVVGSTGIKLHVDARIVSSLFGLRGGVVDRSVLSNMR